MQLARRGRRGVFTMQNQTNDNFLQNYHIEFPSPLALSVVHAEPITLIRGQGYTFSAEALEMIHYLVAPSGMSGTEFNKWITSGKTPSHYQILFFFDMSYHMAHHICGIRSSWDEIAMTSYLGVEAHANNINTPAPVGLLYVADVPTLTELAQRSPFLGLLLPIADGPPDDGMVAYFLGEAELQLFACEISDEVLVL